MNQSAVAHLLNPMIDFSVEHYRKLISDLHERISDRTRAEQDLAAFEASGNEPTSFALDESLGQVTHAIERKIAAADERYADERKAIDESFCSAEVAAQADFQRTAAEVRQRYVDRVSEVESRYDENCWMLSSLLDDDAEDSPKRRYETTRNRLQEARGRLATRWADLRSLYDRAVELVEERRQRTSGVAEATTAPRDMKATLDGFDAADAEVRRCSERLRRQYVPRFFAGWTVILLGLSLWGGLFVAGYLLLDPATIGLRDVKRADYALLSGGAGLVITSLLLLTLWGIAARQIARVFGPLLQGVVDANAYHQHWLRLAGEELQRAEKEYRDRHQALVERRDASYRRFAAERDRLRQELCEGRDRELVGPSKRREESLREASERRGRDLLVSEATHHRETTALRTHLDRERERLVEQHRRRTTERESERRRRRDAIAESWNAGVRGLQAASEAALSESPHLFPAWPDLVAADRAAPTTIPAGIRIGDYELDWSDVGDLPDRSSSRPNASSVRLPAVLPFPASPSLVLDAPVARRTEVASLLQVAMLRLLTSLPPGKVRFTILDPAGLGESFAGFMHLADFDDLLISGRIWTEPAHIEEQLGKLTEHMENVFQKYLRNEFESLEDYNIHAGEVAEPYRVLVVAGFPGGFSDRAAERLAAIAASGPRCGVYTLVGLDSRGPLPHGFDLEAIESSGTLLRWADGAFVTEDLGPQPVPLRPDAPPPPAEFAAIVRRVGELSKHVRRVEVPFRRVAPSDGDLWTADSRRSIDCPLGRAGATKLQHLRLGTGTSQHVLVAGKTGSGKSTMLHVLVTNLALRYAPDEIEFYLIDFKKGVEFKAYASHALPHARVIAIESDREFGVSVLERLDTLLRTRGDLFREIGVQDVAAFRDARPSIPMPRVLLVVDEFQEFFTEDDRYAQIAALLLDRLVRQGRAFGIHVLLGSQTLGGAYSLARTTVGQMAVRIALQCGEADANLILSEENAAARLLTRPGEAIYNDANGLVEGNSPFQVAWLGDEERDEQLDRIRGLALRYGFTPRPPVVFEGNVPADPSRNTELLRRLENAAEGRTSETGAAPSAWIGEAVALTGPAEVVFRRQSGANLLLVGQDAAAAGGILAACLVGLSAYSGADGDCSSPALHLLAGDMMGVSGVSRWSPVIEAVERPMRVVGPGGLAAVIADIAAEVQRRRDEQSNGPPLFFLIDDLSRFRELRRSDDDLGFGGFDRERAVSPARHVAEILREGPAVGVHAIVWCDSYNNADRWLGRQLLREFETRVAFQMSGADSSNLIDSPAASRIGANRALLHSDERGTTEKFRPYGPPTDEWLARVRDLLRPRVASEESEELDIDAWVVT